MKLKDLGVEKAMVKKIDTCKNVVSVEDLNSGNEIEIHGDGIDDSVYVMQYY
jgi:alpha-D-ribose 1-methylphosphonate 5-triphosphate synthase subunit PhnH